MELQAIIMAAGRGDGLSDLTNSLPKPLLPVGNKPLICYPVNMLARVGFQEAIVVTLNSIKPMVTHALKDIKMTLEIIGIPDEANMDTVDSLRYIKDYIKCDMLIVSCDIITDVPLHRLVDVYREHEPTVSMLICPARPEPETIVGMKTKNKGHQRHREFIGFHDVGDSQYRILLLENEADLEDTHSVKMSKLRRFPQMFIQTDLHDAHMYVVKKWVLDYITHNTSRTSFRSDLLPYIVEKQFSKPKKPLTNTSNGSNGLNESKAVPNLKDIHTFVPPACKDDLLFDLNLSYKPESEDPNEIACYAYLHSDGIVLNVNNISAYMEANRIVSKLDSDFLGDATRIHSTVSIHEKSQIGSDCLVGEKTTVGERTSIKRSVIGKDCTVGANVKISNCVLMDQVNVEDGCILQGSIVSQLGVIGKKSDLRDCLVGPRRIVAPSTKLFKESLVENVVMELE